MSERIRAASHLHDMLHERGWADADQVFHKAFGEAFDLQLPDFMEPQPLRPDPGKPEPGLSAWEFWGIAGIAFGIVVVLLVTAHPWQP